MNNQHTKQCKSCGKELNKSEKICPYCGKDQRNIFLKHKGITILLVMIAFCMIGGVFGWEKNNLTNEKPKSITTNNQQTKGLELVGDVCASSDTMGLTYFQGMVKNNTDKDYSYAQITFTLFDKNGNQIGSAIDSINNLKSGSTWNFKAICNNNKSDIYSYKLDQLTAY